MPAYVVFAAGTALLVGLVIILASLTERALDPLPDGGAMLGNRRLSVGELYLNVIVSQFVVVGLLLGLLWYTEIPVQALGIGEHGYAIGTHLGLGAALGVVLYGANELSVRIMDRVGIDYSESLRGALTPHGISGWVILILVVLPMIAVAEEVIFRAAMIGAIHAGFDVAPAVLVIVSSIAFAIGHGLQGTGGILVTGMLGLVLGAAFVVTGSLLVVVVAHYVVNVLEFSIHEGWSR